MNVQLNSQLIVVIQVLIVVGFVIWMVSRRGGTPKPTILNLTKDKTTNISPEHSPDKLISKHLGTQQLNKTPLPVKPLIDGTGKDFKLISQPTSKYKNKNFDTLFLNEEAVNKAKNLNIIFMWNGHSWDAYEVFGLPAGSSLEKVREKFNELKSVSDDGQVQFLAAAMKAIENKTAAS